MLIGSLLGVIDRGDHEDDDDGVAAELGAACGVSMPAIWRNTSTIGNSKPDAERQHHVRRSA